MSMFIKSAQSTIKRPYQSITVLTNKRFTQKFNTAKAQADNTARPKAVNIARLKVVKTARPNSAVVNAVRVNQANALKTSACWVWRPTKPDIASITLKKHNYIDARGRSKSWMLKAHDWEHSLLLDFKEFDKGYVTFGGGAHGDRITGKQHRASCKSKVLNPITKPLFMLHMDLFGPTFVSSLMHKKYCLVVTDDYSRFTWVFFLTTKDETNEILKNFIKEIENLVDKKEKIIRCDNGTEFKNKVMDDFCREKGIRREYSVARTPQQNCVAERRNKTLIEAARTMLADSKLPTTFWPEAVSTACYVQNRVLVVKPHNKTPYELFRGFELALSFMRPFGCHVIILNTLDNLGKFDGKSDEGFFVGYSLSSKAFRVYNTITMRVEENLHIGFLENKPMIEGNGPKWLFDIDSLTQFMNYVPVAAGTISNESVGTQGELNAGTSTQKQEINQDCIVMPIWKDASYFDSPSKDVGNGKLKSAADDQKQVEDGPDNENDENDKSEDDSSPKEVNAAGQHVNTASPEVNTGRFKLNTVDPSVSTASSNDQDSPKDMFKMGASHTLEATHVEFFSDEDELEVDLGNILNSYTVPTTPNTRIHKDHSIKDVIGDVKSSVQTRRMTKPTSEQGFFSAVYEHKIHDTLNTCLYACFLSQIEPTSIAKALSDSSWVEAMQEELLQFKLQQVWILVDLPIGKRAIRTKWVFRNKKDKRGIVIRNKARLVLTKVYVDDIIFGSTNKELCTRFEKLMKDKFQMSSMGELTFFLGLQVQQKEDGIFISQDKYVDEFHVTPKTSHLLAVKRIFRYLKGKLTLGLWYSRDSPFELVAYTDSDYAGATQDRKSTIGGCQFLGNRLISWQCKKQTVVATSTSKPEYVAAANLLQKVLMLEVSVHWFSRHVKRGQDTKIPQSSGPPVMVGDEAVHKELGDRMERAATTASSLEAEQDSGNINRTQSMATLNEPNP
ncbi:putative ribonuclease H-like domain-containing protein [Tanacetum coccineum]